MSRADTLIKRLALRGNPASSSSTFPRPEHPLFPIQQESNKALIESLSAEILSATEIAKKVDAMAKAYTVGYEAVKHVENLAATATNLSTTFNTLRKEAGGHRDMGNHRMDQKLSSQSKFRYKISCLTCFGSEYIEKKFW
jgi:hypothetical protein